MSKLWWLLTVAGGVYVAIGALLWLMQNKLVFMPSRIVVVTPGSIGLEFEQLTLKTPDGERLSAWFIPADKPRATLLFCHGNAGNMSHRLDSIRIFRDLGLSVLIFDYRGYGLSTGAPSEEGAYIDAQTAWDFLIRTRRLKPENIVIFGRSLGSAIAARLAVQNPPGALILESALTSAADVAQKFYRIYPARFLTRIGFATKSVLARNKAPLLLIHSPDDEIVPYAQGRALYELAHPPKSFLDIKGGHNDGFLVSGRHYIAGLARFLDRHVGSR
jgi:fermentation-respiration switch protein FrsA (DUF1100 family)